MFHYYVSFFGEEMDKDPLVKESGIVKGNSYVEAMEMISRWFGEDHIVSVELYELDEVLSYDDLEEMIHEG